MANTEVASNFEEFVVFPMESVFNCPLGLRWRLLHFILSETGGPEAAKVSGQGTRQDRASAVAWGKSYIRVRVALKRKIKRTIIVSSRCTTRLITRVERIENTKGQKEKSAKADQQIAPVVTLQRGK